MTHHPDILPECFAKSVISIWSINGRASGYAQSPKLFLRSLVQLVPFCYGQVALTRNRNVWVSWLNLVVTVTWPNSYAILWQLLLGQYITWKQLTDCGYSRKMSNTRITKAYLINEAETKHNNNKITKHHLSELPFLLNPSFMRLVFLIILEFTDYWKLYLCISGSWCFLFFVCLLIMNLLTDFFWMLCVF